MNVCERSPDWICKKNEIACHVKTLFEAHNEDPAYFDEYMRELLTKDIDKVLECFRDLVRQLEWIKPGWSQNVQTKNKQSYQPRNFSRNKNG